MSGFSVDRLEADHTVAHEAGAADKVVLLTAHAGTVAVVSGGRRKVYGPSQSSLAAQPGEAYSGQGCAACCTVAMFDPVLLTEVAATGACGGQ
ncbi:hypothetical protein C6N75_04515 [Streptomyces solincola]|uniref:Uncharacterized protein n=1 Tax=Streptomyces solincola TaxID=2100817 RepID=A0A2S9Q133_9ACTN|nr:hypothetical protein [Streptomyces solincola]PRH80390.1 hypothetical protein C6N75_04515 [Streptomyces solincola]